MSYTTAKQLYDDIATRAKTHSGEPFPDSNVAIFNALLTEAKKNYPNDVVIQAILVASKSNRYGEMLAPAGQLMRAIKDAAEPALPVVSAPPATPLPSEW